MTRKRKALIMDLGQNQKTIPRKPRETGAFALNENMRLPEWCGRGGIV